MKFIIIWGILLVSLGVRASFKIKVEPPNPVKGESFNVSFELETDSDEDPFISFTPVGLDVLGRSNQVSLKTIIENGTFKSSRNISIVYEMIADRGGTAYLKDISVELGGQKLTHPPVTIKVQEQRAQARDVFLLAELNKESFYRGEGVDIRYYLYYRVPVVQAEYKSFPKLNGFIKRFHKVVEQEERVEYQGRVYSRVLKYSARAYPEKIGKLHIDPLSLNLKIAKSTSSPFGSFGLAFNRFKSTTVSSRDVVVEVKPLPAENVPPNFTGLVGKHNFNFSITKKRFVVNEAIEARLEVTGVGALEKLDPIKFYSDPSLEEFDTKSEFTEVDLVSGKKVFEYTFLARSDGTLPAKDYRVAIFNPETSQYEQIMIPIPELTIGGGSASDQAAFVGNNPDVSTKTGGTREIQRNINAPLFEENWKSLPPNWTFLLSLVMGILILFQVIEYGFYLYRFHKPETEVDQLIYRIKKEGVSYSELTNLISLLDKEAMLRGVNIKSIIADSQLGDKDKKYFLTTLETLELKSYSGAAGKRSKKVRFQSNSFKALVKAIEQKSYIRKLSGHSYESLELNP